MEARNAEKDAEWLTGMSMAPEGFPWAEFGVAGGSNLVRYMFKHAAGREIWGFDSWDGLPEDWYRGEGKPTKVKGSYRADRPDHLHQKYDKLHLVQGWFKDSLPYYQTGMPWGFISIDSDLYSSCKTVLECMKFRIHRDTVIRFDEFYGYPEAPFHEQQAWKEWLYWNERTAKEIARSYGGSTWIVTN